MLEYITFCYTLNRCTNSKKRELNERKIYIFLLLVLVFITFSCDNSLNNPIQSLEQISTQNSLNKVVDCGPTPPLIGTIYNTIYQGHPRYIGTKLFHEQEGFKYNVKSVMVHGNGKEK